MKLHELLRRWSALEVNLIGICTALALAVQLLVMTTRYLLPQVALSWAEQVVIYFVVWALWLSSSQVVERGEHIRNDLLVRKLPPLWRRRAQRLNAVLGLFFCIALCWGGWQVVHFAWTVGERSEGGVAIPLALYYLSLPVGALLMGGKYLLLATEQLREESAGEEPPEETD